LLSIARAVKNNDMEFAIPSIHYKTTESGWKMPSARKGDLTWLNEHEQLSVQCHFCCHNNMS
jgi:hypothetical protein